jgi:hypothetical protein
MFYNYDTNDDTDTLSTVSITTYSSDEVDELTNIIVNNSKYNLLVPEIFNKTIHGVSEESDPNINGQYMVIEKFNIKHNTNIKTLFEKINKECCSINKYYNSIYNKLDNNYIKNYSNIIKSSNYVKPEIGEIYYLRGDECVCIIKTFWLKIIQRSWKKIYKIRQKIKQMRNRPDAILYKQLTGKIKNEYLYMPSIRGMLLP